MPSEADAAQVIERDGVRGRTLDVDLEVQVRAGRVPGASVRPMICPAFTGSPTFTSKVLWCMYLRTTPAPQSRSVCMPPPYESAGSRRGTTPSHAARSGVRSGVSRLESRSSPLPAYWPTGPGPSSTSTRTQVRTAVASVSFRIGGRSKRPRDLGGRPEH